MITTRGDVYKAIDSERDYQQSFITEKFDNEDTTHRVSAELALMKVYLDRAFVAYADNAGDESALEVIRKIAGLCVRCMENHGAPLRK